MRLEEAEVAVEEEEVKARKHDASIGDTNMEDEEDNEENVEIVSVEESLKKLSSNSSESCRPHYESKN